MAPERRVSHRASGHGSIGPAPLRVARGETRVDPPPPTLARGGRAALVTPRLLGFHARREIILMRPNAHRLITHSPPRGGTRCC